MERMPKGISTDFEKFCDYCEDFEPTASKLWAGYELERTVLTCTRINGCRKIARHIEIMEKR